MPYDLSRPFATSSLASRSLTDRGLNSNDGALGRGPASDVSYIRDFGKGIVRGAVGGAQGAYGLLDMVAFDALPDWRDNPISQTETIPGMIAEMLTQFATGFVPGLGLASKVGKATRFASLARPMSAARMSFAGAFSDLTVWQGNDGRLVDMVKDVPVLGVLTQFLQSDEDDSELEGRLKNVAEGLMLDGLMEVVSMLRPAAREARKAAMLGKNPDEALRRVFNEEEFYSVWRNFREKQLEPKLRETALQKKPLSLGPGFLNNADSSRIRKAMAQFAASPADDMSRTYARSSSDLRNIKMMKGSIFDKYSKVVLDEPEEITTGAWKNYSKKLDEFESIVFDLEDRSPGLIVRSGAGRISEDQEKYLKMLANFYSEDVLDETNLQLMLMSLKGSDYSFMRNLVSANTIAQERAVDIPTIPQERADTLLGAAMEIGKSQVSEFEVGAPFQIWMNEEMLAKYPGASSALVLAHELGHVAFFQAREVTTSKSRVFKRLRASDGIEAIYNDLVENGKIKQFIREEMGVIQEDYVEYLSENVDEFFAQSAATILAREGDMGLEIAGFGDKMRKFWGTVAFDIGRLLQLEPRLVDPKIVRRWQDLTKLTMGIHEPGEEAYEALLRLSDKVADEFIPDYQRPPGGKLKMTKGRLHPEFLMSPAPNEGRLIDAVPERPIYTEADSMSLQNMRASFRRQADLLGDSDFVTDYTKDSAAVTIEQTFKEIGGDEATRALFEDKGSSNLLTLSREVAEVSLGTARNGSLDLGHGARIARSFFTRTKKGIAQEFRDVYENIRVSMIDADETLLTRLDEGNATPAETMLKSFDAFMGSLVMGTREVPQLSDEARQILAAMRNSSEAALDPARALWGKKVIATARKELIDKQAPVDLSQIRGVDIDTVAKYRRVVDPDEEDAAVAAARIQSFADEMSRAAKVAEEASKLSPEEAEKYLQKHLQIISNPRNLTAEERAVSGVQKWQMNTKHFLEGDMDAAELFRLFEAEARSAYRKIPKVSEEQIASLASQEIATLTGKTINEAGLIYADMLAFGQDLVEKGQSFRVGTVAYRKMLTTASNEIYRALKKAIPEAVDPIRHIENMSREQLVKLDYMLEKLEKLYDVQMMLKNIKGGALRDERLPLNLLGQMEDQITELVTTRGGEKAMRERIVRAYKAVVEGEDLNIFGRVIDTTRKSRWETAATMAKDAFVAALLSGPRTLTLQTTTGVNLLGLPLERMMGGGLLSALFPGKNYSQVVSDAISEIGQYWEFANDFFVAYARTVGGSENFKLLAKDGRVFDEAASTFSKSSITAKNAEYVLGGAKFVAAAQKAMANSNGGFADMLKFMAKTLGAPIDAYGKAAQLIGNLTQAPDIAFQQVMYRGIVKNALMKRGKNVLGLSGDALLRYVDDEMLVMTKDWHALTPKIAHERGVQAGRRIGLGGEELKDYARKYALDYMAENDRGAIAEMAIKDVKVATFKDQWENPVIEGITRVLDDAPPQMGLWLVVPFKRTPLSILKFGIERSPIALGKALYDVVAAMGIGGKTGAELSNGLMKELLTGDPRTQAQAAGKMMTAFATTGSALWMASNGWITGNGPRNREERAALMETGWRPYSIFIGDNPALPRTGTYLSYLKMEQIAFPISLAADITDSYRYGVSDRNLRDAHLGEHFVMAMINNITSRSYLQGLAKLYDVMKDPTQVGNVTKAIAAGFVPNVADQLLQVDLPYVGEDPYLRETRGIFDAMTATIPGMSKRLPVRRNFLGEPIKRRSYLGGDISSYLEAVSFVEVNTVEDDVIMREMRNIGASFDVPNAIKNGMDLREITDPTGRSVYDRWQERISKTRVEGKTLRQAIRDLIRSPEYKRATPVSQVGLESPRKGMIRNILTRYRQAAWEEEISRNGTLRSLERDRLARSRRASGYTVEDILR